MAEVLNAPGEGSPHFSGLRRTTSHGFLNSDLANSYLQTSTKHPYDNVEYGPKHSTSLPSSAPSSPLSHNFLSNHTSYSSTAASSLSLDTKADALRDDDITFPAYDGAVQFEHEEDVEFSHNTIPPTPSPEGDDLPTMRPRTGSADIPISVGDDQAIERQPTRHVDYLSHEWKEEDIWSSWRYIVARRGAFSNSTRLENASWRTWAKSKNNLRTISPETLNWLKDCDVTWLYGPLQTDTHKPSATIPSPPPTQLHPSASFLSKKPILKKRSASEAILQRSISSHSLLKHAGAILKAQQAGTPRLRPNFLRASSDFSVPVFSRTSILNTPAGDDSLSYPSGRLSVASSGTQTPSERRHIHFNNEVVQCIAVERPVVDYEDDDTTLDDDEDDEDEDEDEGIVMMKHVPSRARSNTRSAPRSSLDDIRKIIAPLPPTTLRGDTPEPSESVTPKASGIWPSRPIFSPRPSEETLTTSRPSNFLLDDDEEAGDLDWEPPQSSGIQVPIRQSEPGYDEEDETDPGPGMHRTPSGMFMPYDEDEEEAIMNHTLFGRVVDTVNTARDIAHVIWNVGWRR